MVLAENIVKQENIVFNSMGLLGGISGIVGGIFGGNAASKAARAQNKAIEKQQKMLEQLTPEALNALAVQADRARALNRLALEKEVDPEMYALRELGKKNLLAEAQIPADAQPSSILARTLFNEVRDEDPRTSALKDLLFKNAEEELKAGAALPPEFQAELLRAGLNQGSQAGIQVTPTTTGGTIARLIGQGGIQLKQQREQAGAALGGMAAHLQSSRYNILASIFPTLQQSEAAKKQAALSEFMAGNMAVPESGLSGVQQVNAKIGNVTAQNNLLSQHGQVQANKVLAKNAATQQVIGGAADILGGVALPGVGDLMNFGGGGVSTPPPGTTTTPFNSFNSDPYGVKFNWLQGYQ